MAKKSAPSMLNALWKPRKRHQAANRRRAPRMFESLEARNLLAVTTFQHGVGGYESQQDTVIFSGSPDANFGSEGHVSADQQDFNNVRQGLVKFEDIFGNAPGQIPLGSKINSATLVMYVQDDSNAAMQMSLYRMLTDWEESVATWNSFGTIGGVQASEDESSNLPPDALLLDSETTLDRPATAGRFDVTRSLEYWASGAQNFGWLVESAATNGWDFRTRESNVTDRPRLIIDYTAPAGTSFQVLSTSISEAEGNAGTRTASVEVARLGDLSGAASVNYTVTAGGANPAQPGDFTSVPAPQSLNFAPGQGLATIEVTINSDTSIEGLETVLVTLTGGTIVSGRDVTTVTIADDDVLINEVLANVSDSDDETDREYIELSGTPGASLNGYYFVVFEGEEEENSGAGSGLADFVIDLSPYTFGANGLLVFVPGDPNISGLTWEYASVAAAGSNIVELPALMGAGGILEDNSQTYALIRSPLAAIVQGTDYDTIGAYENADATAIGVGVGILDQLPAGAQLIDSVGVVEGGGNDRDRVATTAAQGHPGVHVHQPTPVTQGGNVTSDAVSRRFGQTLPNSIGAWFNGDISNGNPAGAPIRYLEDSVGNISVVSPDGSVLTPGAPNVLRNVFFRVLDQTKEVAEADGTVTVRIERTGDVANESLTVTYSTLDFGSAIAGADFTAKSETLTFNPGESFKDVTIDITENDGLAEGFERFRIVLSNASTGYLITNGSPTGAGNPNGEATITIRDANVSIATFQNGVDGYVGTTDAYLDGQFIVDKFGQDPIVRVDQSKGASVGPPQQGLIRFADLFGGAAGQIPSGARIFDAFLTLNVTSTASDADIRLFRMLQDWEQVNATWQSPQGNAGGVISNGVTPDGFEATAQADAVVTQPGRGGLVQIPLNVETIQSWANGSLTNFGWSIVSNSASLWSFNSSEAFLPGTFKPELTILYTDPVVADQGTFGFSVDQYTVNETGSTATVTVNRVGGSNGAATVNWSLADGTGTLADITGASAGAINFANGELFKTFTVAINNDSSLERNETLNLTLSGTGLTFGQSTATLTIRDNDFVPTSGNMLLSEIYMNSPGNDPPHEFIELTGLANMGMGSLYYVAVEGLVGNNEGAFDKVVDLGPYLNGSNGLSLLTPQEPGYAFNVNPATTHIQDLGTVARENVNTNNDSVTILILYSPSRELSNFQFDYDWDNDGSLDLPLGVQIVDSLGVRTLGANDQVYGPTANILTFTAAEVDSVSRRRDQMTPADRNDGAAWFGGNLTSAGDDYLLYEASSVALPVTGASMTPGDVNTGTAVQSPLASLTNIAASPSGAITLTFNGNISQVLSGDGSAVPATGSGITITDTNGLVIPIVDARPTVSGVGTGTLTLSFTGSGVSGGQLPAGTYQLNFVGNGFVANGRAVDVANNGTQVNGFREFEFTVSAAPADADFDNDNDVDGADFLTWQRNLGTSSGATNGQGDANGDAAVTGADLGVWRANFGAAVAAATPMPAASSVAAFTAEPPATAVAATLDADVVDLAMAASAFGAKPRVAAGRPNFRPGAASPQSGAAMRFATLTLPTDRVAGARADADSADATDDAFGELGALDCELVAAL